jgi:molybdopterin converting factor small subunit
MNDIELQSGFKRNEIILKYEQDISDKNQLHQQEISQINQKYQEIIEKLEEKLTKSKKDFKTSIELKNEEINDLKYTIKFLKKQVFDKETYFEDSEKFYKTKIQELEDSLLNSNKAIETQEVKLTEQLENIQIKYYTKHQEIAKKFETEKQEIKIKSDEAYSELRNYYKEKSKKNKQKITEKINLMTQDFNKVTDSLTNKLNAKKKIVKVLKEDLGNLKMHIKYMETTSNIFSSARASITPSRPSIDKKKIFFRPVSVSLNRIKTIKY